MNKGAIEKRIETLELQTHADGWAAYLAWLEALPEFEMPDFNRETVVEVDAALSRRFPELVTIPSREENEYEAQSLALDAAEDSGLTRDQIMRQFDAPRPPSQAVTLESQHFAALILGLLEREELTSDERAFLLAVEASHEWAAMLEGSCGV